jgi:hypothetical protein
MMRPFEVIAPPPPRSALAASLFNDSQQGQQGWMRLESASISTTDLLADTLLGVHPLTQDLLSQYPLSALPPLVG